ncbi:MAG: DNA replication complex GINS family protein [Thaumarchaeota archaeon]|nr:DNA replication complex GINS family protein [Nitrososphaerota archaeon]
MSARIVADEFRQMLRRVEVGFENSLDEVSMLRDVQKLSLPSGVIEGIKAGTNLRIYRWIARKLIEKDLAKPVEDVLDIKSILQLRWKERNSPAELQPLPKYFYLRARESLRRKDSEIAPHLKDIYSLRLTKIMNLVSKRVPESAVGNLTEEEKVLYECLLSVVDAWYDFIEGGDEK